MPQAVLAKTIDANELLREVAMRQGVRLEALVAETALWANPEVHRRLAARGGSAAFFPNSRRCRKGETRGQKIGIVRLGDNTYANLAIKLAVGVGREQLIGFEACHIWPLACYDERYHTLIANLVLLPRALAGMSDHSPEVQAALQYHAFDLYGWYPDDQPIPVLPVGYPIESEWQKPMPFSEEVERALAKRISRGNAGSREEPRADRSPICRATRPNNRDLPRYDIAFGDRVLPHWPKRTAMLTFVKELVSAGVSPDQISAALPSMGKRLFRSAPGYLDSEAFIAALVPDERYGKRFRTIRWSCKGDQLIRFGDRTWALTNQWGPWTVACIDALVQAFPNSGFTVTPRA